MRPRTIVVATALTALVIGACDARPTVTEGGTPTSAVDTGSHAKGTPRDRADEAWFSGATSESAAPTSGGDEAGPEQTSPQDGVRAAPHDVEIPDVDELDELLADIDAALAGIDLDADEGDMP